MILKTYARLWADDMEATLPLLQELVGRKPDLRFAFDDVEVAAIGDLLVVAGPAAELERYRNASATVIVDDLDMLAEQVTAFGGVITVPETTSETGRHLCARHAGGAEVEYVEWVPEIVEQILDPKA